MTVEIKELVIRASVPGSDSLMPSSEHRAPTSLTATDVDLIVERCVRKVLRTWRRRRDR